MKYLTLSLAVTISTSSVYANENQQECRAGAELNPSNRFSQHIISTDAGDYKVINDTATGLQWSYCFVGQQLDGNGIECEGQPIVPHDIEKKEDGFPNVRQVTMDEVQRENQRLGEQKPSWRLPNIKELLSIYNESCSPAIYPIFSYAMNAQPDVIDKLTQGKPAGDEMETLEAALKAAKEEGGQTGDDKVARIETAMKYKAKAYQNYTLVSDTAFIDNSYKTYYNVNFKGWGSMFNTKQLVQSTGLLRLVREIPQQ